MVRAQQNAKLKQRNAEEAIKRSAYSWFIYIKILGFVVSKNIINIICHPSVDFTEPNLFVNYFKSNEGEILVLLVWASTPFK